MIRPTSRSTPSLLHPIRGFTLIEMMVALSVTAVLLLLVNRIFNQTTRAIGLGSDTSTILAHSRTINDQLYADAQKMIPAKGWSVENRDAPGAFLVIVQQLNGGEAGSDDGWVLFPPAGQPGLDPDGWVADANGSWNGRTTTLNAQTREVPGNFLEIGDYIHSDQIAFFRDASRMESAASGSTDGYDSNASANFARIWFGHSSRFDIDADPSATPIVGTEAGQQNNQLVTDLVMGRQALLLLDERGSWPSGDESTGGIPGGDLVAETSGNGNYDLTDALRQRIDLAPTDNADDNDALWLARTDVLRIVDPAVAGGVTTTAFSFDDLFERDAYNLPDSDGTGQLPGFFENNTNYANPTLDRANGGFDALTLLELPTTDYEQAAMGWAFLDEGRRLVNRQFIDYPFAAEDISQTHTHFVPYVSDIIIDFAADILDDYTYDRTRFPGGVPDPDATFEQTEPILGQLGTTGTIGVRNNESGYAAAGGVGDQFAPDGLADGRPDEYVFIDPATNEVRRAIKWYNAVSINVADVNGIPLDPTRAITWPIPVDRPYLTGAIPDQSFGPYHSVRMNGTDSPDNILYPTYITAGGGLTIGGPAIGQQTTANPNLNEFVANGETLFPSSGAIAGNFYGRPYPPLVGLINEDGAVGTVVPPNGSLADNVRRRAVFVFGHTPDGVFDANITELDKLSYKGSAKWWPYLIRIRYRLHDGDASYTSGDELGENIRMSGKWFEQIIPIPRYDLPPVPQP